VMSRVYHFCSVWEPGIRVRVRECRYYLSYCTRVTGRHNQTGRRRWQVYLSQYAQGHRQSKTVIFIDLCSFALPRFHLYVKTFLTPCNIFFSFCLLPFFAGVGSVIDVPAAFFRSVLERRTQVTLSEAMVPLMLFFYERRSLADSTILAFTDNMAVQCSLCLGRSKARDIDALCQAIQLKSTELRLSTWWEYVQSQSNCSDGGSRVGVTCRLARKLGIVLQQRPFPTLPDWRAAELQDWMRFLS